jgi:single-strand DNA-binding protein
MASDFNHFAFIGRIVGDCKINYTATGKSVVNFSMAINEKYNDKEYANFVDIVMWGKFGEALSKYLLKGQQILVSGSIRQDRWQKDGQNHSKIKFVAKDVQLLGGKKSNGNPEDWAGKPENTTSNVDASEDIPF